jgi:hypothetical protein
MRRLALAVAVPLLFLLAPPAFADDAGDADAATTEPDEGGAAEAAAEAEAEASEPEAEETEVAEEEPEAEEEGGYELKPIDVWAIDLANRVSIGLNGVLTAPADPVMFTLEGDEVFKDLWMPAVTGRVMGLFAGLCQMPYRAMMGAFDAAFAWAPYLKPVSPVPRFKLLFWAEHPDE